MSDLVKILLAAVVAFGSTLGCGQTKIDPPKPLGTVFSGDPTSFPTPTTGAGACGTGCGSAAILPGFRASVVNSGGTVKLEGAENRTVAVSSNGFLNITTNLFDGTGKLYTFTYAVKDLAGQYAVIGMRDWATGTDQFTKAGFLYAEAVTGGATNTSTAANGSLALVSVTSTRVTGTYNGKATLNAQDVSISSEFNVPVQAQ